MPLSTLPYLELVASFYGTIFIGFGFLWFINPVKAISFFEVPYPQLDVKQSNKKATLSAADLEQTMDVISIVYGIRDVFMGVVIYIVALCGTRLALGWVMIAAGGVAATDGAACKFVVGKGHMNHWSYAPVLVVLGGVMIGAFDKLL